MDHSIILGFSGPKLDKSKRNVGSRLKQSLDNFVAYLKAKTASFHRRHYLAAIVLDLAMMVFVVGIGLNPARELLSPVLYHLHPLAQPRSDYQVFGFAPYWTLNKLSTVNFNTLTTLAYFDIPIKTNGDLVQGGQGYKTFLSPDATRLFERAHEHGTQVVMTITQMDCGSITNFLENEQAQENAINQSLELITRRGIDGVNVDFECAIDPGQAAREQFSQFVYNLTRRTHQENPNSQVTISVLASSIKKPLLYDIGSLAQAADGIFIMAYDFATLGSNKAMPTSPLYGYDSGDYWYDVSSAVRDFLTQMPANKLILGLPWYGYEYAVVKPAVNSHVNQGYPVYYYTLYKKRKKLVRSWVKPQPRVQTYSVAADLFQPTNPDLNNFLTGWDELGRVSYKAYYSSQDKSWRMLFLDDLRSLQEKYEFAKKQELAGVGIWALGYEEGNIELWEQLNATFGNHEGRLAQNLENGNY